MRNKYVEEAQLRYHTMLAERAYEANRIICAAIGDDVSPPWREAEDWQKESAICCAEILYASLDCTPATLHEVWMKRMKEAGWKHGTAKSASKKTHPRMVAYGDLPLEQQLKDHMFILCVTGRGALDPPKARKRYSCGADLVNAVTHLIQNLTAEKPHKDILSEWDADRGMEWFK